MLKSNPFSYFTTLERWSFFIPNQQNFIITWSHFLYPEQSLNLSTNNCDFCSLYNLERFFWSYFKYKMYDDSIKVLLLHVSI